MSNEKYYMGVADVTWYKVHFDVFSKEIVMTENEECKCSKQYDDFHERYFSKKFVNDPMKAIFHAYCENGRLTNNPEFQKYFFEKLYYSPTTKCFYIDEYLTTGSGLPPKECQWKEFFNGKYEFDMVRTEMQALETSIAKVDPKSCNLFFGQTKPIDILPDEKVAETFDVDENNDEIFQWEIRYKLKNLKKEKLILTF